MSATTGQRIGKYDVQATLATSPRTRVFRALDPGTGQAVAIKAIPRAHVNEAALPAYRKFSLPLSRLDHPGVARFIELIENDKAVWLVSELCEGVPLSFLLKDGAQPEMKNVWDIARRMLEALAIVHVKGLMHGDLKPANVMLAPDGGLKITDFGVSALLLGAPETIYYRAPEQFGGEGSVGPRTDIYQAGAIIYHLITGKLPFTGTPAEVEHRVHQERPTDPSSYNNKIAWQLDWVVQKALSKDPIERFNAPTDFAEGLRLGLQDTVGRPLDPIKQAQSTPTSAPAPAPTPVREPTKPPVAAVPARPTAAGAPAKSGAQSSTLAGAQSPTPNLAQKAQAFAKPPAAAGLARPIAPGAPAKAGAQTKARILFVDDDERILNAVRALFRHDYEVTTAEGGDAALEALKTLDFHVIVSDQRMPGITGVELLRQARTLAPNAVRMLLTGYTDLAGARGLDQPGRDLQVRDEAVGQRRDPQVDGRRGAHRARARRHSPRHARPGPPGRRPRR
jgi:serine/threonine-protein kinase